MVSLANQWNKSGPPSVFSVFCRDPNHPSVPYHYYEPLGPDECTMYISHERGRKGSHHRFITEKRVFENWARTFNIHFFQPDWKPESLTINHAKIKLVFWGTDAQGCNHNHLLYQASGDWLSYHSKPTWKRKVNRVCGWKLLQYSGSCCQGIPKKNIWYPIVS